MLEQVKNILEGVHSKLEKLFDEAFKNTNNLFIKIDHEDLEDT